MNSELRVISICLILLTSFAFAVILGITKTVLIPFTLSIFMYLIIAPLMEVMQEKLKIGQKLTMAITIIGFILSVSLLSFLVVSSVDTFIEDADQYSAKIDSASQSFTHWLKVNGINFEADKTSDFIKKLPVGSTLKKLSASVLNIFSNSILIIIFTLFLLAGESKSTKSVDIFVEIKKSISSYVNTKLLLSLVTGVLVFIILISFSVDLAFMFSLLTVLLNFIPNIGSMIAILLPLPVLMLQFGFGWKFFVIMSLTSAVQMIIGNIIEPKLMGDNIGLHPVTILFFLAFWGFVWGIPGMFLSVPITAAIKIILMKFEMTKPVADLLAGEWTFTK